MLAVLLVISTAAAPPEGANGHTDVSSGLLDEWGSAEWGSAASASHDDTDHADEHSSGDSSGDSRGHDPHVPPSPQCASWCVAHHEVRSLVECKNDHAHAHAHVSAQI